MNVVVKIMVQETTIKSTERELRCVTDIGWDTNGQVLMIEQTNVPLFQAGTIGTVRRGIRKIFIPLSRIVSFWTEEMTDQPTPEPKVEPTQ